MQEWADKRWMQGGTALIIRNGKVVYYKAVGYNDIEAKVLMKRDDIFRIAPQTKAITSVAIMQLMEEGKLLLDDPVSKYLPEYSNQQVVNDPTIGSSSGTHPAISSITVRQLLSHTAGMTHGIAPIAYDKEIWNATLLNPNIKTLGDRVTELSKHPLMWDPGIKWNYSFSPDVVGRLVEVISGKTLAELS